MLIGSMVSSVLFPQVFGWIPATRATRRSTKTMGLVSVPTCTAPVTSIKSSSSLSANMDNADMLLDSGPFIVGFALVIGIAAQGWINNMTQGDRGLGAFLRDGGGFAGSGFSKIGSSDGDAVSGADPLPWLKLPDLDFVEVAGKEQSAEMQLEGLRLKMNKALQEGKLEQATELRQELEAIMKANGFDFTPEE